MIRQRLLRQTLTIARRDFVATVFTPLFLVFLLSPLIMIAFGVVGGIGGATLARGSTDRERIAVIAPASDKPALTAADARLRQVFRPDEAPPALEVLTPKGDTAAQARTAMEDHEADTAAVLYGPLDQPHIRYGAHGKRTADYLAALAETVLRDRASGAATALSHPDKAPFERIKPTKSGHSQAAFFAVFGIFFLTLFLSTQAVGTMAEERSNKVIEVLAAAVPLEAVFLGKLIGMFGVAVLFVSFWGTLISQAIQLLPIDGVRVFGDVGPAVGVPAFVVLFCAYFTMAYMLLGAVFLGVGAQAQTMREIQMLSLPITIVQMAMFGLSSAAASSPGSTIAHVAEIFPLSSPFAMAAHAANSPELWPHALAIAWQALWVGVTITIGARAFRRGVLKSGAGPKRGKASAQPG
ncbi:ABC transporter permease [Sphingomonas sp. GlSt437]|uniref:ABC transporter permease n=1 Tax=Sphingomonas sp. GlSt437 TaxID=3389970 RepID=UPI003A86DB09